MESRVVTCNILTSNLEVSKLIKWCEECSLCIKKVNHFDRCRVVDWHRGVVAFRLAWPLYILASHIECGRYFIELFDLFYGNLSMPLIVLSLAFFSVSFMRSVFIVETQQLLLYLDMFSANRPQVVFAVWLAGLKNFIGPFFSQYSAVI